MQLPESGRIPVPLRLCRACRRFVRIENEACDFCGSDLAALEAEHVANLADLETAKEALRAAINAVHRDAIDRQAATRMETPDHDGGHPA